MDKKTILRLLLVPLILYMFYTLGFPLEIIAILGVLYIALILLRGKIWRTAERVIEKYLPFTKTWPNWAQKALLIIFFILIYLVLKQIIYFLLGLVGIDLEKMLLASMNIS
ncbi:MAG: hypothetical protein ABIH20_06665 [Candidatus Diapherotrites archaeon]